MIMTVFSQSYAHRRSLDGSKHSQNFKLQLMAKWKQMMKACYESNQGLRIIVLSLVLREVTTSPKYSFLNLV